MAPLSIRELTDLAAALDGPERAREAETTLLERLCHARARELLKLAARARTSLHVSLRRFDIDHSSPSEDWIERRAALHPVARACLASIHRNGYYREAGTRYLSKPVKADAELALPFLLLRADDTIESTRRTAEAAITRCLLPGLAHVFARALPIRRPTHRTSSVALACSQIGAQPSPFGCERT